VLSQRIINKVSGEVGNFRGDQVMNIEPATLELGNRIPLIRTLNIQLQEIGDSHAIMEVVVAAIHANYFGGAHGGLIATLADSVSFFPRPLLPSGQACTTTSLNVTYVRPAALGDRLTARSELVHLGRRLASVTCRIVNQHGKLVAHSSATLLMLTGQSEEP
jgi:acyl-CoA thioesterase